MMNDFVWPSDRDRAENDELNRVCEYAEQLLGALEAARAQGDAEKEAEKEESKGDFPLKEESLIRKAARAQGEQDAEPVGYTNYAQIGYVAEGDDGMFYPDTEHGCDIPLYTRPPSAGVPEPDIFWDCDISEISHEDEYELADDCAQDLPYGESMLIDVMCAKQLPKRQMKVWINDEDEGLQWEWVQPPAGQEGE